MGDSVRKFRKPLIGGFHRHDVIKYITKLAQQRNEAILAREEAESKHQDLLDAIAELHKRNVDICREVSAYKPPDLSVLDAAAETFLQLEKTVARLHKELEKACGNTPAELINAARSVEQILPIIEKSRQQINEIHESVNAECGAETAENQAQNVF